MRITSWIKNLNKPEITIEIGTVKRGKYTLPNKFAFAIKVPDVFVKHSEK